MALWKDQIKTASGASEPTAPPARFDAIAPALPEHRPEPLPHATAAIPAHTPTREKAKSESLIAPDIAIEGKIEGAGHVRIAGRFKGDVNVNGDLTIEAKANVAGSVRAEKVVIAGDLVGNIEAAAQVELLQSGSLTGDLKAGSLTVAAGSRMRGHADFGWSDADLKKVERNGSEHGGKT
jgi:cytoskeletal protein CcmA (bactofilin family)